MSGPYMMSDRSSPTLLDRDHSSYKSLLGRSMPIPRLLYCMAKSLHQHLSHLDSSSVEYPQLPKQAVPRPPTRRFFCVPS